MPKSPAVSVSPGLGLDKGEAHQNLVLGALGVVFGDIGTSPLYTLQICMGETKDVTLHGIMGILSLIVWSLIAVVTLKYVVVVMRADNRGEGGILALTALAMRGVSSRGKLAALVLAAGMAGAALFYGDGVITPAISVLSAVEGLKVIAPGLEPYVVPLTILLLVGLFAVQKRGTASVGRYFGPITAAVVCRRLPPRVPISSALNPETLGALNPAWGFELLYRHPLKGFVLLGAVVLAVTGAEALYADMGHFGRRADQPRLAISRLPRAAAELFRPGRPSAFRPCRGRQPVLPSLPHLGADPDGGPGIGGDDHRLAGGDIRRVFHDQPGGAAGLPAAHADPAHLGAGTRPDLRTQDQHAAALRRRRAGARLPLFGQPWLCLRYRCHRHDES